jgi:hypothetical protein
MCTNTSKYVQTSFEAYARVLLHVTFIVVNMLSYKDRLTLDILIEPTFYMSFLLVSRGKAGAQRGSSSTSLEGSA